MSSRSRGVFAALVLAIALAAGCTDDGTLVTPAASATPARPSPGIDGPRQPVATPPRVAPPGAVAAPTPLPHVTPYVPPAEVTPTPATPDPNAPTPTPLVTPSDATAPGLPYTQLARLDAPTTSVLPHPTPVVIRTQTALTGFLRATLGQPASALPGVDFTREEVIAIYDPGSADPAGCVDPALVKFVAGATAIAIVPDPLAFTAGCTGDIVRPAGYVFFSLAASPKTVANATEWTNP